MGNYKFRLSDMIPNAWFYKLKDMSRSRSRSRRNPHHPNKKKQSSTSCCTPSNNNNNVFSQKQPVVGVSSQQHRQSFYYTWESFTPRLADQNSPTDVYFPADPPRRSSKRRSRTRRKTVYKPSPRRVTAALHDDDDDDDCGRPCQGQAEAASFASNSLQKNYFDSYSTATTTATDSSLEFFDLLKYADAPNGAGAEAGAGGAESRSSTCSCGFSSSAATADIIIDVNEKYFNTRNFDHSNKLLFDDAAFDRIPELDLPPILTKPTKLDPNEEAAAAASALALGNSSSLPLPPVKTVKPRKETATPTPSGLRGIKLRANSPKVATKKNQGQGGQGRSRKSTSKSQKKVFSESFAVVKASFDPQKDFRDSMMEMIVENNIRASKDLEDLLACYLSLNSDEYHHLIINAFEQIWFNIPHPKF